MKNNFKKIIAAAIISSVLVMASGCTSTVKTVEKPDVDRGGNAIELPDEVDSIVSLAPSTTETLIDLGLADKIIAVDMYSLVYAADLAEDIPTYDMYSPDIEAIISLEPDIVFTSGMVYDSGNNPYQGINDAGYCVVDIPSSNSIEDIKADIVFIGECVGANDEAKDIVDDMDARIAEITAIAETIPADEQKSVMFWLSIPTTDYPEIYSVGKDTYLDEIITTIGAVNVTGDLDAWAALSEEDAVDLNPDVILHSVSYIDGASDIILSSDSLQSVTAVTDGQVYYIDENSSNQPNAHVVDAMIQMAKYIYPDYYEQFEDPFA